MEVEEEHPARHSGVLTCPGVPKPARTLPVYTRREVAARIATGELLVVHAPLVYRVPRAWLRLHPGGDLAILHYVGRDATCEIEAYHSGKTVADKMQRWVVAQVEMDEHHGWIDMVPPVQLGLWPPPPPRITVTGADDSVAQGQGEAAAPALTAELVDPPLPEGSLPLTPAYQHHLRQAHRSLHARLHELNLLTPPGPLSGYGRSLVLYAALAALSVWLYMRATSTPGYALAAAALGVFWHQVTFVVHDAGHTGLTGDWWSDRVAGALIANCIGGLSVGWWCDNHNVHHLVTNAPEHDPDIQHLPFFAISTRFFESLKSTYYQSIVAFDAFARVVIPVQAHLYYVVMSLARFNLFALSYGFLLKQCLALARGTLSRNAPTYKVGTNLSPASPLAKLLALEIAGISVFWLWFTAVLRAIPTTQARVTYLLVAFIFASPVHVQIVLSHFSQSVSIFADPSKASPRLELLESFPHRQLRTTMDVSCPPYLDWFHGGLNHQVSHHLFPRVPRFRFRDVQKVVQGWVADEQRLASEGQFGQLEKNEGLNYKIMTFVDGNQDVLRVLRDVSNQVRVLRACAQKVAAGEIDH